jgi:hypothetical protein
MCNGLCSWLLRLCQRTFLLTSLALLASVAVLAEDAKDVAPRPLQARLEVVESSYDFSEPVLLRIVVENSGPPCGGTLIDPTIVSKSWGYRPFLLTTLEVHDETGRQLTSSEPLPKQMAGAYAGEFLRLDCGEVFGGYLRLSGAPASDWVYHFPPGVYRVRGRISSRMLSFVRDTPTMKREIAAAFGVREEVVLRWLRDENLETNEVVFEVKPGADEKAGIGQEHLAVPPPDAL